MQCIAELLLDFKKQPSPRLNSKVEESIKNGKPTEEYPGKENSDEETTDIPHFGSRKLSYYLWGEQPFWVAEQSREILGNTGGHTER